MAFIQITAMIPKKHNNFIRRDHFVLLSLFDTKSKRQFNNPIDGLLLGYFSLLHDFRIIYFYALKIKDTPGCFLNNIQYM